MLSSRLLVFAVAAAVWLASSTCNARNDDMLLMSTERVAEKFTFYPVYPFDTAQATVTRYRRFITNVREELESGNTAHGIPVLYNPTKLSNSDRYLLVGLYNSAGAGIDLAIDKTNTYVIGYRTVYKAIFFPEFLNTSIVFPGYPRYALPFESRFSKMEKIAGPIGEIGLGMGKLSQSIQYLHDNSTIENLASSMMIVIQMVAQAFRYRYIENIVVEHITSDEDNTVFFPDATMIAFEDSWDNLSKSIQSSVAGIIYPAFVLPEASEPVTSITPTFGLNIALLLYVSSNGYIPEPPVHIVGRNGLCADVQDGLYVDGNPVVLWPCRSNNDKNQLWTFMKDGTIQSNGKCLTAYRLGVHQYLMIYSCTTAPKYSGTKWEIQENGDVINKESKLAMTAYAGVSWSVLTLDQKSYTSSQGWTFTNNTKPVVTPIVSYSDLCVQASSNDTVQLAACSKKSVQEWAIYPDGTVRPSMSTTNCLASKSTKDGKSTLALQLCDGGNSERWLFNHDRTVSDASNKYVLEASNDNKINVVTRSGDTPTKEQTFNVLAL